MIDIYQPAKYVRHECRWVPECDHWRCSIPECGATTYRDPVEAGIAKHPVYECCNDACPWRGTRDETVHPKHEPDHLLCPECHEVVEPS